MASRRTSNTRLTHVVELILVHHAGVVIIVISPLLPFLLLRWGSSNFFSHLETLLVLFELFLVLNNFALDFYNILLEVGVLLWNTVALLSVKRRPRNFFSRYKPSLGFSRLNIFRVGWGSLSKLLLLINRRHVPSASIAACLA